MSDAVHHPAHYGQHPSGVTCIEITRHMGFDLGNAVKYIWRADLKGDAIEDLNKAAWYLHDEIVRRGGTPEFVPRATTEAKAPEPSVDEGTRCTEVLCAYHGEPVSRAHGHTAVKQP